MRWYDVLDLIWREINTPSGQTGPLDTAYRRAVVGIGHGPRSIWRHGGQLRDRGRGVEGKSIL